MILKLKLLSLIVGRSQLAEPDDDFFELTVEDAKIIQVYTFLDHIRLLLLKDSSS